MHSCDVVAPRGPETRNGTFTLEQQEVSTVQMVDPNDLRH